MSNDGTDMLNKILLGTVALYVTLMMGCARPEPDSIKLLNNIISNVSLSQDDKSSLEAVKADLSNGKNEAALDKLDAILKSEIENYYIHALYVLICIDGGYWEKAIEPAKRMVSIKPDDTSYLGLGQVYGGNNMLPEAVDALKKAVELNPNNAGAREFLGTAYAEMGNKEEAQKEYEILSKVDSSAAMRVQRVIETGKAQR